MSGYVKHIHVRVNETPERDHSHIIPLSYIYSKVLNYFMVESATHLTQERSTVRWCLDHRLVVDKANEEWGCGRLLSWELSHIKQSIFGVCLF
jgi:hypothetical protein